MDDPKNPNQNPLDPVVPTTPITDVPSVSPPAPEPLSPEEQSTPPVISDLQQDVPPPPPSDLPPSVESDLSAGDAGLPPVVAPPPAKSKTKLFAAIAAVVLLLVSIPAGVLLVKQQQELRKEAAAGCACVGGFYQGDDCPVSKVGTSCPEGLGDCICKDGIQQNAAGKVCSIEGQGCTTTDTDCICKDGIQQHAPGKICALEGNSCEKTIPPPAQEQTCTYGESCGSGGTRSCTGTTQDGVCKFKSGIDPNCSACTTCGDGICGGGEGADNCPADCGGGGGTGKIPSEQDGPGGCCDQGAAANSAKGCRTTGGFNEVCDIANGACQSGFSCRSLAGCTKDTDCGPGNKCVNNKCEIGGGPPPPPPPPPPPASSPPITNTCSATIAGLPGDFISPNQSIPVTVKLDSSTAGCEYVALRTDGTHEPSLKTVSGACVGATYGATINSGLAGQHKLEFAVNDTQPYPGAPSRSKTVCSTKTFETIDLITAPTAYCTNLQVLRGGAPVTDLSKIQVGDHLNLQASCITTTSNLSFDKIRFRITAPSGAKPDQDQTATKDVTARIHQVAEQPNIYKATGILTIDRIGSYNIKVWGHTKEDNKWKGKK